MNIYEITQEYSQIAEALEAAEGEITPEIAALLEINEANKEKKISAYVHILRDAEAKLEAIDKETKRLADIKKRLNKQCDQLETGLLLATQTFGAPNKSGNKVYDFTTTNGVPVKFMERRSESVVITTEDLGTLPEQYVKTKTEQSVDKTAIKEAIKAGETIDGAYIATNISLSIK